jgi:hypothetical protein
MRKRTKFILGGLAAFILGGGGAIVYNRFKQSKGRKRQFNGGKPISCPCYEGNNIVYPTRGSQIFTMNLDDYKRTRNGESCYVGITFRNGVKPRGKAEVDKSVINIERGDSELVKITTKNNFGTRVATKTEFTESTVKMVGY